MASRDTDEVAWSEELGEGVEGGEDVLGGGEGPSPGLGGVGRWRWRWVSVSVRHCGCEG